MKNFLILAAVAATLMGCGQAGDTGTGTTGEAAPTAKPSPTASATTGATSSPAPTTPSASPSGTPAPAPGTAAPKDIDGK
jgi:uncharacterized lipoprotein NlpE involved in copper resistance